MTLIAIANLGPIRDIKEKARNGFCLQLYG